MKGIITFTLYGFESKYSIGMIRNCQLAKEIYPNWMVYLYYNLDVPNGTIFTLEEFDNVKLIPIYEMGSWKAQQNRYLAIAEDCDYIISRDADSRLNYREKAAVDEWIASGKLGHIMRDHPAHATKMLGGMWGIKNGIIPNIKQLIDDYNGNRNLYENDYEFLARVIYPYIENSVLVHDEIHNINPFPTKREGLQFVGEVIDQNEKPNLQHRQILANWIKLNEKM